jgi:hypothetical protein
VRIITKGTEIDPQRQRAGIQQRQAHDGEADRDHVTGLHHRHQPADQRNQDDDGDAAGRQHQPRPGRGVHQGLLRKLRDDHGAGVEDRAHRADQDAAGGKIAVLENSQIDDRLLGDQQPADRA